MLSTKTQFVLFQTFIFFTIFVFGSIGQVQAAVAIDSTSSSGAFNSVGVTSFSWQHTVTPGGVSRVLYVGVSTSSEGLLPSVEICTTVPALCQNELPVPVGLGSRVVTVTYNGAPMESVGVSLSPDLKNAVEIFRLVNPPEGANTVNVDLVDGVSYYAVGGSISFTGADEPATQTLFTSQGTNDAPNVFVNGASGTSGIALGVVATTPNSLFIANPSMTGQDLQWNGRNFFSNSFDVGAGSTKPASPSTTLTWTMTNPGNWATVGVLVKSFPATASPTSLSGRVLTQSGRGVFKAFVVLTNNSGERRVVLTNPFGYFHFDDVPCDETSVISVISKRYSFSPQTVNPVNDLTGLTFTAEP